MGRATSAETTKNASALLVGVSQFEDKQFRGHPLPCAENDVHDFKRLLCEELGWKDDKCQVLHGRVTKESVREALNLQIDAARAGGGIPLFLFYISTHGHFFDEQNQPQTGILLTSDTKVTNLPTAFDTGISNQSLSGYMREIRSLQKLIISDACFAGTAVSASSGTPLSFYDSVDAAVVASSRFESYAAPNGRNSLFTECLLNTLRSARGSIVFPTIFEPIFETVRDKAAQVGKDQEPQLSHQGGVILLGYIGDTMVPTKIFSFEEAQQSCMDILTNQLRRSSQDSPAAQSYYVARQETESNFWDFVVKPDGAPAFTIVGSAGTGKSTTMAHLALAAARRGHLVLWLGEGTEASDLLVLVARWLERVDPGLTLLDAAGHVPPDKAIFVFLDAINEWPNDVATIKDFLKRSLHIAAENSLRLVVSCRENSWPDIGEPFNWQNTYLKVDSGFRNDPDFKDDPEYIDKSKPPEQMAVSSGLSTFNDQEFQRAIAVYSGVDRFHVGSIGRNPLLVRIISQLGEAKTATSGDLSLLDALDDYLQIRVEKIARRIMRRPTQVFEAIDRVIERLARDRSESIAREVFFGELSEPIAVALLDEGLFKYSGEEIVVEVEIIHEHLLSRILPVEMFTDEERFLATIRSSRLVPGAVLFRLSRMNNRDLANKVLRWIDQNGPLDVLDALDRLPRLNPYWSFFSLWFAQNSDLQAPIARVLRRRANLEIDFSLNAAKVLFLDENYYPWEKKRWRDVSYQTFKQRVDSMPGAPQLLAQCAAERPEVVLPALVNDWLGDKTKLEGGIASISDVAETYLSALGQQFPEIAFAALTQVMRERPRSESVEAILTQLAHMIPGEASRQAAAWIKSYPYYLFSVVAELGLDHSAEAMALAKKAIDGNEHESNLVESIIASVARFQTQEALDLVIEMKDRKELINGLIIAITRLHSKFPDKCEVIAKELCWRPHLSANTLGYAASFYWAVAQRSPSESLEFFHHVVALNLPETGGTISYQMIDLAKLESAEIRSFIDERLRVEEDPYALFNYAIALDRFRTLRVDDFGWLKRWISKPSFRETEFVLELLVASEISLHDIANIVFQMEKDHATLERGKQSPRLQALAQEVLKDRRFRSLREYSKRIWTQVARGDDPHEASLRAYPELRKERKSD
jgi:hypothetical protein